MAAAIELKLDDAEVRKFFSDITKRTKDATEAHRTYATAISSFVFQDVIDHFKTESGPQGEWQAWSDSYKKHLQSIGRAGNKILQFSGRMRQAFTPSQYRTKSEGIEWYNPAKTASGYPYAWGHNEGDGKLPQREFMWLSDKALEKIGQFTLNFVLGDKS